MELVERDAWLDLFAAAPADCVRELGLDWQRLGAMGLLAGRKLPAFEFNRAMCVGVTEPAVDAELDGAAAWLDLNAAPSWALQVSPDAETGALRRWLDRQGLAASGRGWAKFRRGSAPIPSTRSSSLEVRQVGAEEAAAFGQVVQAGFGLPPATADWFGAMADRPGWRLYLAYDGESPVAAGAAFWQDGHAWLGVDATLADHRRRGAQTALIRRRVEDGLAAGLDGFTAETGQPETGREAQHASYSNYVRAGFTPAYSRPNYARGG
jgi:hypothetical protein